MRLRPVVRGPTAVLAVAMLLGSAWRLGYALVAHRPADFDYSDMHGYITVAQHMADPHAPFDLYDWYYPRGTALALAAWMRAVGPSAWATWAAAGQAGLACVEILLMYVLGRRALDERAGAWAAAMFAAHYLSVSYTGFFLSENYLTFALMAGLVVLSPHVPWRAGLAGLLLGYAAWVKPQACLMAAVLATGLLFSPRTRRSGLLLGLGAAAVVSVASALTSQAAGHPAFVSLNGGQTFCLSHCPYRAIACEADGMRLGFALSTVWERARRHEEEAQWQRASYDVSFLDNGFYLQEGLKCLQAQPTRAAALAVQHVADLFNGPPWSRVGPWPENATAWRRSAMHVNLVFCYTVVPLAVWGAWLQRRNMILILPWVATWTCLVVSAWVFHGDPRFRVPYDFVFILAAVPGIRAAMSWALRSSSASK